MTGKSTCSLDAVRAANPDIGIALYAYDPSGPVTLEAHTPDGQVFTWRAETVEAAIAVAFPDEVAEDNFAEEPQSPTTDIFA